MKKILVLAALATTLASAPALAGGGHGRGGHGIAIGANVLSGHGGVLGLLNGRSALVTNVSVATGKNGVLGAVLGKGRLLGGLLGGGHGGCGCY
jgi:hypothetical protein